MSWRPTIDDAVSLLTDPELATTQPPVDAYIRMQGVAIIDELMRLGLERAAARSLVAEALGQLGGINRSGVRLSRAREETWEEDFWVPERMLDDQA